MSTHAVSASLLDGTSTMATITVPEDAEAFSRAVTMTPTSASSSDAAIEIGADGVWVSNSYAEHQNAKPGDVLNVTTGDGSSYQLPIAGFYRHYLSGYQVIMSKELYKEVFGFDAQASKLLIARKGADYEALKGKLEPVEYISAVIDDKTDQETLFNTFRKVSRVVVMVYLALSFAMALVVLLNLNFMFVEEKRRDLITLMVCGYSVSDAKRYIWRDNVVLTVLGIAIGVLLGMIAGWAAVCSMELGAMSLVKTPDAIACLLGIAVSGSLSCAMTLIALRRVSKLELPDINKS